ncbi:MAG: hypothetical protein EOO89_07635, partial [Pedobacter sp.]
MTRMPKVQQLVQNIFGKPASKSVNPDEVFRGVKTDESEPFLFLSFSPPILAKVTRVVLNKAIRMLNPDDAEVITLFYKGEQ